MRNRVEVVGLVAEHHKVDSLGQLAVGRDALTAELIDERLRAPGAAVGAEHGLTPATRHRARHVP